MSNRCRVCNVPILSGCVLCDTCPSDKLTGPMFDTLKADDITDVPRVDMPSILAPAFEELKQEIDAAVQVTCCTTTKADDEDTIIASEHAEHAEYFMCCTACHGELIGDDHAHFICSSCGLCDSCGDIVRPEMRPKRI